MPTQEKELQVGDRIIIHVLEWGKNERESKGEMSGYIGHISDPSCDVRAAIEEFELKYAFPEKVVLEAHSFGKTVPSKEISQREDLRYLECVTIDPETAKDYDDALSLTLDEQGNYHLGVHIADVTYYVKPGSFLDKEARERCNSTYFPGTVLPMLPHELSSHLCSLMPNVNRLAVSVLIKFDQNGNLSDYRITRSVIKSRKRFSYGEAKAVLDGEKKSKYASHLLLMVDLCHRLKKKRYERGSIEFAFPDISIRVDEKGAPVKIERVEYDITHQLVEEFMLKANELIATHLSNQGKPLTYRVHEQPNPENIKEFAARCRIFGFQLPDEPTGEQLQNLFDQARGTPYGQFIATAFVRSMRLATYSAQNVGHFGLGLEHYTHFTSPIRRYIDLIVHRVLFNHLTNAENLDQVALQCSEKERLSARAEGAVILLKKLRLLKEAQNTHPHKQYEAVVTQIKPFGCIFEVSEFLLEGFFHLSQLDNDYYIFDEENCGLIGNRTGTRFFAGDKICVTVESINLINQEVKWRLGSLESSNQKPKRRRR